MNNLFPFRPTSGRALRPHRLRLRRVFSAGLGLLLVGGLPAAAAPTQQAHFKQIGGLATGNYANKVQVEGDLAYVADGLDGLKVVNVSNPAGPMVVGAFATGGDARDLSIVGTRAYVATGEAGLQVIDVSNPAAPSRVGTFDTSGIAYAVQVVGNLAYVADGLAGLQIIDVGDGANPVRLGGFNTSGEAVGVQVAGNVAYVADGASGLQLIDVTAPATPSRLGGNNTPDYAKAVQVVGNLAYVADGFTGFQVLDLSNQLSPSRVSTTSQSGGRAYGINVVGDRAYVADLNLGLLVYDVSVPASPVLLGQVGTGTEGYTTQVVGNRVYLANGVLGLQIFEVQVGLTQEVNVTGIAPGPLALNTPHAFGTTASSGLPVTVSVRGPAVVHNGTLTVTNFGLVTLVLEQVGNDQYLPVRAEVRFNVPVVRASRLGGISAPTFAQSVKVVGHLAYLATGQSLRVIDVSTPANPVEVGSLASAGWAEALEVVGNLVYVAAGESGLEVIDVSNPASPTRLGGFDTTGAARDVRVLGNLAFVADAAGGLIILDVSNPAVPVMVGSFDTPDWAVAVQVVGNRAYVVDDSNGLVVLDISNPAQPTRLGGFDTPGLASNVQVVGTLAYVSSGSSGVHVVDVSDPARPTLLRSVRPTGNSRELQVVGHLGYLAGEFSGLQVMDLSDPANPASLGGFDTTGSANGVLVLGNVVYVADGSAGLQIIDLRVGQPQSLAWELPAQLPFTGQPLVLAAATTSGLPLTFSVVDGPGTIQGDQLTVTGPGRVRLRAQQAGDADYAPDAVERVIIVGLPRMAALLSGPSPEVFWAAGLDGLWLEGRESLGAETPWQRVMLPWLSGNGQVRVSVESSPFRFFRLQGASGLAEPLELTGWNRDVVLENRTGTKASPLDSFGAVWFESGLGGHADGFPTNRQIVSQLDAGVIFELQPYASSNVLWLNGAKRTNSLTLAAPAAYRKLHVLAHSAGGGGNGSLKVHFADGTASAAVPFFAPDWWDGSPNIPTRRPAIQGLGRSLTAFAFNYEPVPPGFSLHQTDIDLGADAGKVIARLEFVKGNTPEVTAIFAVSGIAVPPAP